MARREELLKVIGDNKTLVPMIDEIIYLEEQLDMLRKLPKIKVNPKNPEQQKATPAAKMYKEYFQQYINAIKAIEKSVGTNDEETISPLREWVSKRANSQ